MTDHPHRLSLDSAAHVVSSRVVEIVRHVLGDANRIDHLPAGETLYRFDGPHLTSTYAGPLRVHGAILPGSPVGCRFGFTVERFDGSSRLYGRGDTVLGIYTLVRRRRQGHMTAMIDTVERAGYHMLHILPSPFLRPFHARRGCVQRFVKTADLPTDLGEGVHFVHLSGRAEVWSRPPVPWPAAAYRPHRVAIDEAACDVSPRVLQIVSRVVGDADCIDGIPKGELRYRFDCGDVTDTYIGPGAIDGIILPDTPTGRRFGLTCDRFAPASRLVADGEEVTIIWVRAVQPLQGHFSALMDRIETEGYTVSLLSPPPYLVPFLRRRGFEKRCTTTELPRDLLGGMRLSLHACEPVDIWTRKRPTTCARAAQCE